MAERVYFQWQNPYLCKTIYPMRTVKLRDFLVYYQEIDIWKQLKGKSIDEIPEQVKAYKEAKTKAQLESVAAYASLRTYFLTADVASLYSDIPEPDPDELTEIQSLHDAFNSYFPKYNDIRKEKYFVEERVTTWKMRRKDALGRIASQQRRVDNIAPEHPKRPEEIAKLERMRTVGFAMLERELAQLEAFAKAIATILPRRVELDKSRQGSLRRKDEIARQQESLRTNMAPLETKTAELRAELDRLKNPPDISALEAYFLTADVTETVHARYPHVSPAMLETINAVHKELAENYAYAKTADAKAGTVRTYFWRMKEVDRATRKGITKLEADLRNMPADWAHRADREAALVVQRDTDLPLVTAELASLADFQAGLLSTGQSDEERASEIERKGKELAAESGKLSELQTEYDALQSELDNIEAELSIFDEEKMVQYQPEENLNIWHIASWKSDAYKESLMEKDQYELLALIRERFEREPKRFPLWLQYMVVHFSGMRYASAHGSWADPKDLLVRLRAPGIEEQVKALSDEKIEQICKEKIAAYESSIGQKNALANSLDKEWTQQIGWHLPNMKSSGPQTRRRGLTDMRKLEDAYDVKSKSTEEALYILLSKKATFPSWAWKEVVRLTPLRQIEVTDENWEKLTPEEEQESFKQENYPMRSLIDEWKNFDATAWREEHGRTHQLIVSRAVCNETAEHCQHLRGHLPPGGLTPKPNWYIGNEKSQEYPGSYFVKATKAEEYKQGASVLWLRFANSMPNPWQVAKPISTKEGVGLLPGDFTGRKAGGQKDAPTWVYKMGEVTTRQRVTVNEDKTRGKQEQFLRWIHEATVAEVAETADGPTVITYETALPDDDKGTSAIGIFKMPLDYFLSDGKEETYNRSFVGYVPEGKVPVEHINPMLDWDKILLK